MSGGQRRRNARPISDFVRVNWLEPSVAVPQPPAMRDPFRYFNSSPEVIRLAVMIYVRYPLSLRQVEDLLFERGIDNCHETDRTWGNRFGPIFASEIRKRRLQHRSFSQWRWHLGEVFVRINGETYYLWRAVDHESEVLEASVMKKRDRKAALRILRRTMKRYGHVEAIATDRLRSTRAAMKVIGNGECQETGAGSTTELLVRERVGVQRSSRARKRIPRCKDPLRVSAPLVLLGPISGRRFSSPARPSGSYGSA